MVFINNLGESMSLDQIKEAFQELLDQQSPYFGEMPSKFTTKEFISDILGLATSEEFEASQ